MLSSGNSSGSVFRSVTRKQEVLWGSTQRCSALSSHINRAEIEWRTFFTFLEAPPTLCALLSSLCAAQGKLFAPDKCWGCEPSSCSTEPHDSWIISRARKFSFSLKTHTEELRAKLNVAFSSGPSASSPTKTLISVFGSEISRRGD